MNNIKKFIDQNSKLIMYIIFAILMIFLVIKSLDEYYENEEQKKLANIIQNNTVQNNNSDNNNNNNSSTNETQKEEIKTNTAEYAMKTFINYCNNKEITKAYDMLSDECKKAIYNTEEEFERTYVRIVFDEKKEYTMLPWSSENNIKTYLIKFYGDMLATGTQSSISQEYYTFVKTGDTYKINVNNYIYGKTLNRKFEKNGISILIKNIDIYDSYEEYEISITNNKSTEVCLTGNKYQKNIYLKNSSGTTYSSMGSKFDTEEITLKTNNTKNFTVKFNKVYNASNKVNAIVLSDVIFDYEEYAKTENKKEYKNRTSIEFKF